jgi:hypothetical protein
MSEPEHPIGPPSSSAGPGSGRVRALVRHPGSWPARRRARATVTVLVPSAAGPPEPDGAFDLIGAGVGRDGSWPPPPTRSGRAGLPAETTIVVDEPDRRRARPARLPRARPPGPHDHAHESPRAGRVRSVTCASPGRPGAMPPTSSAARADQPAGRDAPAQRARLHRATFSCSPTGSAHPMCRLPPPMVAWLTARFPDKEVVVVEDATAAVWRGRVLRGVVDVYTRTDLWRLVAHARVTVDLAPGPIIARECVESLRFGTPILVPAQSAARPHADAGGGMTFSGYRRAPGRACPPLRRLRPRHHVVAWAPATPTRTTGTSEPSSTAWRAPWVLRPEPSVGQGAGDPHSNANT